MHPIVGEIDARDVVALAGFVPLVLLPLLYGASGLLSVEFGNVVFALTFVTCIGWVLLDLNDRRGGRRRRTEPTRSGPPERSGDVGTASDAQLLNMARVLLALTGVVVLGWAFLLLSLGRDSGVWT